MIELVWETGRDFAADKPRETRAVYASTDEALLQAAHNELLTPGVAQRIERDGAKTHGPTEIKAAAKRLQKVREDHRAVVLAGPDDLAAVKGP